jgi:hypothetical protein
MEDILAIVGKLYIENTRLQQYAELLQNKVKTLEDAAGVANTVMKNDSESRSQASAKK